MPRRKRNWWSIALFGFVGAALVSGFVVNRRELLDTTGIGEFFVAVAHVLAQPPASIGLCPFHLVVAPTFARSIAAVGYAIVPAIAVHAVFTCSGCCGPTRRSRTRRSRRRRSVRAALDAMRSRRSLVVPKSSRAAKTTLRLASVGHPAMAIFWKNILCLRRTAQLRLLIGPVVMAIAFGAALSSGARDFSLWVAATATTFAGLLIVFGGRLMRNDLRHDMQHLPLLKSLPIRSSDIVLAEVASATLPMVALQLIVIVIACVASFGTERVTLSATMRFAIVAAAPFLMLALNGALITIQNGMAMLFPAWIRLGAAVSTGVEALGQNVLAMIANLFTLLVALLPPTVLAALTFQLLGGMHERTLFAVWLPMVVAAVVLAMETYARDPLAWTGAGARGAAADDLNKLEHLPAGRGRLSDEPCRRGNDRQRACDADRAAEIVEPLGVRVRVAAATAGADRDRRDALADRHVGVGRREREVGLTTDEPRRLDRRLHELILDRRLAAWALADGLDADGERRGAECAARVLFVRGGVRDATDRAFELLELGGRDRSYVDLEPCRRRESSSPKARRRFVRPTRSYAERSEGESRPSERPRRPRRERRSARRTQPTNGRRVRETTRESAAIRARGG